tara:strand:- start:1267 stop:3576 length:2310 start_codon:yes stop_codon:yes gene_type:complete
MKIKLYNATPPQVKAKHIDMVIKPYITMLVWGRQTGKAINVEHEVFTSNGPKKIKELKVGDRIYGDDGQLTDVTDIHNHPSKQVHEVEFEDGTIIDACADHLWEVDRRCGKGVKRTMVMRTEDMLNDHITGSKNEKRYKVKLTKAVSFPEANLPIEPYTLGAMIGDGCTVASTPSITSVDSEIIERIGKYYTVTDWSDPITFGVKGIKADLKALNLNVKSGHKFIPKVYKTSSIAQRTALLQGLMDTDGTSGGNCEYYTVSQQLAKDVKELAASLGMFATVKSKLGKYKGEDHHSYRVRIRPIEDVQIFSLKRKSETVKYNTKYNTNRFNRIVRVEKVDRVVDMKCLTVNNESHLFLTDGYIVTHNTFYMQNDLVERALAGKRGDVIMWVSPIMQQSTKVFLAIESMFADHPELWSKIVIRFDRKNNFIEFYNGVMVKFQSADQGDNLRGGTVTFTYVDECAFMDYNVIEQILMPMHIRTGGRFMWGTTFNGKNWAYKKFKEGQKSKNKEFIVSHMATYKSLKNNDVTEFCEMMRKNMTKANFDQEYLCKPIAAGAIFMNINDAVKPFPHVDSYNQVYIGMDIGVNSDFAVLTAVNERYQMICPQERFNMKENDLNSEQYKQRIKDFYLEHDRDWIKKVTTPEGKVIETNYGSRLVAANFEVNNKELLYDELFEEGLEKLYPIAMTGTNKPDIVNNLVKLFEERIISINEDEGLEEELGGFESKSSPITGKMTYGNNPKSAKHDDRVMSLAHACWCAHEEMDGGTTEFI